MKICFPVAEAQGMASEVYGHFGSAPAFVIVETENNHVTTINNKDQHHSHGACNPLKALNNQKVDAIVVGGIGAGALIKLNQQGTKVFQARGQTVKDNIQLLKDQQLPEFTMQHTCAGHGHAKGCGH
ncbi:MAG: Dinitrogenase iron-molybdenum cofactor biosynthesis protein [Nitrospirae bacterium]|jgi:predicted Fe-Mo cluster-binding NifX family protein|nr:Dinitrogenase iron-molybdenum cofactor biosynthesis protein [Nitrospirota bacterium]